MSALRLIGHYQYDETRPSYARYLLPGLCRQLATGQTPNPIKLEIRAKLEYIPVKAPTDYLIIGNIPALKEMMVALKKAENEPDSVKANQIIAAGTETAKRILDKQLAHYLGDGRTIGITITGSSVGDVQPVPNLW